MSKDLYTFIAILVMCIVTYLPRALPITFITGKIKSEFILNFLYYVPYACLASLTFPAIFTCTGNTIVSLIGALTAVILAIFKQKLYVIAVVCVSLVYGLSFIIYC